MSERHEVTVYDRVPATAAVSVRQVETYLHRTGWRAMGRDAGRGLTCWGRGKLTVWTDHDPNRLADRIAGIAVAEQRQPSAVIADIAQEKVDHA
ncbi:hypothetical protein WMF30_10190 [Sorangium sp. So ce134]